VEEQKKNLSRDEVEPPPPLNSDQRAFARQHLRAQRLLARARRSGASKLEALQILKDANLCQIQQLQGAGGVGKSVLLKAMKRIMLEEGLGEMVVTAWTGVAAAPFGSPTLCTLLKIQFARMKHTEAMNEDAINAMVGAFRDSACAPDRLLVFVVDEMSFLVPEAIEMINIQLQRLCGELDVPFGGVLLLLAGDFTQKPPPNAISLAETLIATDVTHSNPESRAIEPVSNRAKGLEHFRMARRTVLAKLMRAEDVTFQEEQKQLRNTTVANPVPESLLRGLRAMTRQDLRSDPSWAFATICVLSNFERHHLNRLQATNFAKIHDIPLVVWRRKIKNRWLDTCDESTINELYENEPGAWEYFVRGAPAMLNENIQPTKYLANGAVGMFHSLSLVPSAQHEEERIKASGFARIELEQPPAIINFQLELPPEDDGKDIQTLVPGVVVIPVVPSRNTFDYNSTSLFSCLKGVPKTLRCSTFPIDIAFAVTDYKLQGKTKDKLILSLAPRPFPPYQDLKGFYVGVSRVKKRDRLRLLCNAAKRRGGFEHIRDLRHTLELKIWNEAYNAEGDYQLDLAWAAYARHQNTAKPKRQKRCKEPE